MLIAVMAIVYSLLISCNRENVTPKTKEQPTDNNLNTKLEEELNNEVIFSVEDNKDKKPIIGISITLVIARRGTKGSGKECNCVKCNGFGCNFNASSNHDDILDRKKAVNVTIDKSNLNAKFEFLDELPNDGDDYGVFSVDDGMLIQINNEAKGKPTFFKVIPGEYNIDFSNNPYGTLDVQLLEMN